MSAPFSYAEYAEIVETLLEHAPVKDFADVRGSDDFCVVRHDVDLSPERALEMATLERRMGLRSSYFFALRSSVYNALSGEVAGIVYDVAAMGHAVGLHFHVTMVPPKDDLVECVARDIAVMEEALGLSIDRFSFHRAPPEVLAMDLEVQGLVNAYGSRFFGGDVLYVSDSWGEWRHGRPERVVKERARRSQVLVHPCWWSEDGGAGSFDDIVRERRDALRRSMEREVF